jgi:hypothetical protein
MTPSTTLPASTTASAVPAQAPAAQSETMSKSDLWSIIVTVVVGMGLAILAYVSAERYSSGRGWVIGLAVAVGGLGGLVHEIAQSGGKIFFFERKLDGIYIGALAGAILGAVAGLLAIRGLISNNPADAPTSTELIYEAFIAGMALKGVMEAAGGQALPPGSDSVTPGQAMAAEASVTAIAKGAAQAPTLADLDKPFDPPPSTLPADI